MNRRWIWISLTLAKLQAVFNQVMKRKEDKIDRVRSSFGTIQKEPVSLEEKVLSLLDYARKHRRFSFREALEAGAAGIVVSNHGGRGG